MKRLIASLAFVAIAAVGLAPAPAHAAESSGVAMSSSDTGPEGYGRLECILRSPKTVITAGVLAVGALVSVYAFVDEQTDDLREVIIRTSRR